MSITITSKDVETAVNNLLSAEKLILMSNERKAIAEFLGDNYAVILPVYLKEIKKIIDEDFISGSDYVNPISDWDAMKLQTGDKASRITKLFTPA
jgi:acetylglutamate kinase